MCCLCAELAAKKGICAGFLDGVKREVVTIYEVSCALLLGTVLHSAAQYRLLQGHLLLTPQPLARGGQHVAAGDQE